MKTEHHEEKAELARAIEEAYLLGAQFMEAVAYHSFSAAVLGLTARDSRIPRLGEGPRRGIERYPAFGDLIVRVYDAFAWRVRAQRRSYGWTKGPVRNTFNQRAAAHTARLLNLWFDPQSRRWALRLSRPLVANDVKTRLQKRGRASLR